MDQTASYLNQKSNLFLWNPDRSDKYTRIVDAPRDEDGNSLSLWAGAQIANEKIIYLRKKDRKDIPDFLYDVGLQLFVSERARDLISRYCIPHLKFHQARLIDNKKNVLVQLCWINIGLRLPLLDRIRSKFTTLDDTVWNIERFVIAEQAIPQDDIFLCEELGAPVFSARIVAHIRSEDLTGTDFLPLSNLKWP